MITIQKKLTFILIFATFVYSCSPGPTYENTKTEITDVNKETSQPIVTTGQPIEPTSPEEDDKSDRPNNPKTVVTNSNTPQPATAPQPSPDRTNVSPAKVVATKTTASPSPPITDIESTPPSTRSETSAAEKTSPPVTVTEIPEEKERSTTPGSPISSENNEVKQEPQNPPSFYHIAFDELLRKHVSSTGKINYSGIKSEKAKLDGYLENLKKNPPKSDWPRNKAMAFWINAYNAFTVKLILDNYPISSITKLEGGKPWDKKWIQIGDKTYSLNNIENDLLRPKYKDARIHFAVNCAAKSCPPLLNRAWTADNLNSNFEKQAKAFINNPKFNKIEASKVQVSKIFEWYAEDFGNLIDYLNKYASIKIDSNAKLEFMEYDWGLNE